MYSIFKNIHHYVGMATLVFILLLTVVAFIYYLQQRNTSAQIKKISILTLIFTHTQVLLGIILYFNSPVFQNTTIKDMMGIAPLRQTYIEHPFSMIIAAVLITIVNRKIKKFPNVSFSTTLMAAISLALVIGMIPKVFWHTLIPS